ncbi:hypothetical protein VNO77_43152 [Canavalia gladiata]|uniref:Uncharacterized protein n=1 Tax=Canavalia gladiata TaxID=3824 RepID=A0AAN9JTJ6_CANGL
MLGWNLILSSKQSNGPNDLLQSNHPIYCIWCITVSVSRSLATGEPSQRSDLSFLTLPSPKLRFYIIPKATIQRTTFPRTR